MKKPKIISFVVLLFTILSSYQVFAQGANVKKVSVTIEINVENETLTLKGEATRVFTPSSVFVKTYVFTTKLSKEDLVRIQSKFGDYANSIEGISGLLSETGETLNGVGFLNKAGKLTIHLHSNGAGTDFPVGWFGS